MTNHEHSHQHDHDDPFHVHPVTELNVDEFDPANRSLAEALRISFGILKFVVIVLLVVFVAYGSYRPIEEGQVGVVLRFGAPRGEWLGEGGERRLDVEILEPGPHFVLPEPIDRVIVIPTKAQLVSINQAFWLEESMEEAAKPLDQKNARSGGLEPGKDGSLLTSDKNIVHGKWTIGYRIDPARADEFARHIGSTDVTESLRRAEAMVRHAAERAIVQVIASTEVEAFVRTEVDRPAIGRLTQETLDQMGAGIEVTSVLLDTATPPLAVRKDFNAVNEAQSDKAQTIELARRASDKMLTEVGGRGYTELLAVIDEYEQARRGEDEQVIAAAKARIDAMLASPESLEQHGIGGTVAQTIRTAVSDKTNIVATVEAERNGFLSYFNRYAQRDARGNVTGIDEQLRRIIIARLWQDTVQDILTGDIEMFYLPPNSDQVYLELGPNPQIREYREERQRREAIRQAAENPPPAAQPVGDRGRR